MSAGKKLFISYSRTDHDLVAPLLDVIRRMRYDVWFDQELSGGQAWWNTILGHVRECDAFLLAVSERTVESEACQLEFDYARALNKPILPVIVDHVEPMMLWSELAALQLVDYTGPPVRAAVDVIAALSMLPPAGDLPDPLPASPQVPMSYLTELSHQVQARSMTLDEQLAVLVKLKARLQRPGERETALHLIRKLQDRNDLYHATAVEINEVLGDKRIASHEPPRAAITVPLPDPPVIQTAPEVPPPPSQHAQGLSPMAVEQPPADLAPPVVPPQPPAYPETPRAAPASPAAISSPHARKTAFPSPSDEAPTWVVVVLAISTAYAFLGACGTAFLSLVGPGIVSVPLVSTSGAWLLIVLTVLFGIATGACTATLIGLAGRDRWGPLVGWVAVAALALTVIGIPLAAALGWGLARTPAGQLSASGTGRAGRMRLASSAVAALLMLGISGSAAAWRWSQSTPGPAPNTSTAACINIQSGSSTTSGSTGGACELQVASTVVRSDCNQAALPSKLEKASYDYNPPGGYTGAGTVALNSDGCYLTAPSYNVDSELRSAVPLGPVNSAIVTDLVVPNPGQKMYIGVDYGCDDRGCVSTYLYTDDSSLHVWEDDGKTLNTRDVVDTVPGKTTRLVMAVKDRQVRVWWDGVLVETQSVSRGHGGNYDLYLRSFEKASAIRVTFRQFAVFQLA